MATQVITLRKIRAPIAFILASEVSGKMMKASAIRRAYTHWEAWAGVLLCGLCAGIGGYLSGMYFNHSIIPPALGGGIGGYFQSRILDYVIGHYGLDR